MFMHKDNTTSEMIVSDVYPYFNDLLGAVSEARNIVSNDWEEIQKLFNW